MADDDADDRALVREALQESGFGSALETVSDGEELLEYLRREKRYGPPVATHYPAFILLDLNMPRMDGKEVLAVMKSDPALRRIPVIVLSTSTTSEDMAQCYDLGANAYIGKPITFAELVHAMSAVVEHWKVATLAPRPFDASNGESLRADQAATSLPKAFVPTSPGGRHLTLERQVL